LKEDIKLRKENRKRKKSNQVGGRQSFPSLKSGNPKIIVQQEILLLGEARD